MALNIDLTLPLKRELEKAHKAFDDAKAKGETDEAKKMALVCCNILIQLAKSDPNKKTEYIDAAKSYKNYADSGAKPASSAAPANNFEQIRDDQKDLAGYAESLIAKSTVTWKDIGGLDSVKVRIMETIVIAGLQKPVSIKPDKGILLFGPPGTGKTLLAAAAAGSLNATFFNVKVSNVLSKYFGESSKLITSLYETARKKQPSIIFIDEFDSITMSREEESGDASRKVLSTLLSELDGFQDKKSDELLLTLAATNTPWDLDEAILSRFPLRIYIPLPDSRSCEEIIKIQLKGLDITSLNLGKVSEICTRKNYSGRDIQFLCQEALRSMIRVHNPDLYKKSELPFEELKKQTLSIGPMIMEYFETAFERVKSPMTEKDLERFRKWNNEFGL
ncbi:AAA family ATPase [uncultured Methanoregula sp.]|uniref:ATP-binding protein n=1 Tax=uncultured Methanoregula sp. TaxID=1005933 RepID=UPI002AAB30EE|nr:AAA family ATPase [uncultured Methanoregula sp.]